MTPPTQKTMPRSEVADDPFKYGWRYVKRSAWFKDHRNRVTLCGWPGYRFQPQPQASFRLIRPCPSRCNMRTPPTR